MQSFLELVFVIIVRSIIIIQAYLCFVYCKSSSQTNVAENKLMFIVAILYLLHFTVDSFLPASFEI